MNMNKIQVLALDDDNHAVCFVTRGSYYSDAASFMKDCLLKPHTCEYEVRMVTLIDFDPPYAEDWDVDAAFDLLACEMYPETLFTKNSDLWYARENAFNLFWEYADKEGFYV